jgi:dipeptidyl aminopeptidase/acylaminoacyl peptidase
MSLLALTPQSVRLSSRAVLTGYALLCATTLTDMRLSAQAKPLVTAKDLGRWESLGAARLAPNGEWLAYGITRGNEESELRLRNGARDSTAVLPFATGAVFSADSKWLAYLVGVSPKERDRLTKEKKPIRNSFGLRNLTSGETISIADVSAFAFNPSGGFVSLTKYAADGKRTNDVLVLDLAKGTRLVFSNVSEYAWSESKPLLAMAVSADGGNGVHVYDGAIGAVRVLESTPSVYRALSWRPKSDDLAALRSFTAKEYADTAHSVLVWRGAATMNVQPRVLEAGTFTGAPQTVRIADYRRPTWSRDGVTLYVGLRTRNAVADAPKKSEEKVSDVEIWHTNDVRVIPEQRSAEQRDLRATMLAAWRIDQGARLTPLGTDPLETTTVLEGDRYAVEIDRAPYPFGQKFGRRDQDLWVTDIASGTRRKLLTKVRHLFVSDPVGKRVSWFDGRDYWVIDVASGVRTNLTAALRASRGVDFVDREDDHPTDVLPPIGAPLWSADGATVLLNSEYDVWSVGVDGSNAKRLTDGAREGLVHRVVSMGGFGASVADRAVNLGKPVYLSLYGKRSKRSGYARLAPGGEVQRLILADASIGSLAKADSADRYAYVRQSFQESPNAFVAGADLATARQWTETNPFQKDFAWGKAELMNFTSSIGKPLQAILYYPADYYDPSKKYPMIVYTYELLTQGFHRYIVPRENDYYNANVFTQNGYFVLMPDIVFRPREPGIATLHVGGAGGEAAVIARGLGGSRQHRALLVIHRVDTRPTYLATHSKLFATAVMGAGISDMISFAGQMHWSSVPEFDHWETGPVPHAGPALGGHGCDAQELADQQDPSRCRPRACSSRSAATTPRSTCGRASSCTTTRAAPANTPSCCSIPAKDTDWARRRTRSTTSGAFCSGSGTTSRANPHRQWITAGQSWLQRKALLDANK